MIRRAIRLANVASLVFVASSLFAAVEHRLDPQPFAQLTRPLRGGARVQVKNVPLVDGKLETLELEEFSVLAPNAVVEFVDGDRRERLTPSPLRQFRGGVAGVPESLVYVSVGSKISGLVIVRERKFMLKSAPAKRVVDGPQRPREDAFASDVVVAEVEDEQDFAPGTGFMCGETGELVVPKAGRVPQSLALGVAPNAAPTGTQTTMLNLAVETDSAMYANFGSNTVTVETFTRDLVGMASVIYKRDLSTELRLVYLGVRGATDPWAVNPHAVGQSSTTAILEYGDYWHTSPPTGVAKSAAILLSGHYQATGGGGYSAGGIAWRANSGSLLCTDEFFLDPQFYGAPYAGHYAGPYAFCGGIGVTAPERSVPNPDGNPNYAASSSNYWPLLQFSHELGHIAQSPHTHCIQMTPGDQGTYGRTYVDNCFNGESGSGCFGGTQALPADGAGGKGTIMSYCHFTFGGANSRFTFGQNGEASHRIIDDMRAAIADITPTGLSSITAPASLATGATGGASVTNTAGLTFDWTITNGTFTGGGTTATGASVSFSGTVNPVTLRVTATNANGCSISDVASVTINAVVVLPPTNVVAAAASATSVNVMWTAAAGATSYQIFRRGAGESFAQIGTSSTTNYTDNSALANTAYLYMVRSVNGATVSTDSNSDLATTVVFTDSDLTGVPVKATHFTEMLTAINAVRTLAGVGTVSLTPAPAAGGVIVASHVDTLRTGLDDARATLALLAVSYTDDPLTAGTSTKLLHMTELRSGVN